jgi:hypothetical protein
MAAFAKSYRRGSQMIATLGITDAGGRRSERRVHDVVSRRLGYVA